MHLQASYLRRSFLAALLGLTLSSCGTSSAPIASAPSPSAEPSTPAASPAPSATAEPSSSPSAEPSPSSSPAADATATPEASAVLPQPMLFLREGQIMRVERDGTTITPITDEEPGQPDILAVIAFDVSPADGSLVYVVQGREGNQLIRSDAQGQQRTVLLPSAPVNNPRWSPDGKQIAVQMSDPLETGGGPVGGVYLVPAGGGEPQVLQPNDPADALNPDPEVRNYMPQRWSPDGKKLTLTAYARAVEVCNAAVKDIASGKLVTIQAAEEGMFSGCGGGQWTPDSKTLFIGMNRPGAVPPVPGLWKADPETGEVTPFIVGTQGDGSSILVTNQRPFDPNAVYALIANVKTLPDPFDGTIVKYKLYEGRQNDGVPLRDEEFPAVGQALWADDNSGLVADLAQSDGNVTTTWIPANGDPVVELGPFMGEEKHWAGSGQ